jgi:hypothetical protein
MHTFPNLYMQQSTLAFWVHLKITAQPIVVYQTRYKSFLFSVITKQSFLPLEFIGPYKYKFM